MIYKFQYNHLSTFDGNFDLTRSQLIDDVSVFVHKSIITWEYLFPRRAPRQVPAAIL